MGGRVSWRGHVANEPDGRDGKSARARSGVHDRTAAIRSQPHGAYHWGTSNSDAIEATRASFIPTFAGVITVNPNRVLNSVTSAAALDSGSRRRFVTSGTLIVNLRTSGDVVPYATFGAGLISTTGNTPSATLRGDYQFLLGTNRAPIDETDSVTVREAGDSQTFGGILGGWVKYHMSPRWGIRLGVRVALSRNAAKTVADATPNVAVGGRPVVAPWERSPRVSSATTRPTR
jgi:hypothetical protein